MKHIQLLVILIFIGAFSADAQTNNPWEVPEEYKELLNPEEAVKSSLSIGKSVYAKHCKTCHGKTGMGDGPTSKSLDVDPSDLSLDDLDVQKDGEIYFKIITGRDEMPPFKNLVDEEDVWHLVNYIRTFYQE